MFGGYMSRVNIVFLALLGGFLALALLPGMAGASPCLLPPRPTPSPTPPPTPTPVASIAAPAPSNALLRLRVFGGAATPWSDLWTAMEWQDGEGAWHQVDGWLGALDSVESGVGYKTWSVPPSLFGQGPFRWLVYNDSEGSAVAISDPYDLPSFEGHLLIVDVHLERAVPILLPASGHNLKLWPLAGGLLMLLAGLYLWRRKLVS